jgi:hypothetical protein
MQQKFEFMYTLDHIYRLHEEETLELLQTPLCLEVLFQSLFLMVLPRGLAMAFIFRGVINEVGVTAYALAVQDVF